MLPSRRSVPRAGRTPWGADTAFSSRSLGRRMMGRLVKSVLAVAALAAAGLAATLTADAQRIARERDVTRCGREVSDPALKAAFTSVEQLKIDKQFDLRGPTPGSLKRIIGVVEGLHENDWSKVLLHGENEVVTVSETIDYKGVGHA